MRIGHSGDLGDVIYSLPTVRALAGDGQVDFCLYRSGDVREPFDLRRAYNIGCLLDEQPYVRRWRFCEGPEAFDVDFAAWRAGYDGYSNLAHSQAKAFGVDPEVCNRPWLTVGKPARIPVGDGAAAKVVVIRSHRYRQPDFPWQALADRYRDESVCLGGTGECEELMYQFGFKYACKTPTLSEMARAIAGAGLVITNQTCAYAIAEGLHKRVALERWPFCPNVDFPAREGLYVGERIKELL